MSKIKYILTFHLLFFILGSLFSQELSELNKQKPLKISGGISGSGYFYNSTLPYSARNPFGYTLSANLNVKLYGINIPLYASLNNSRSEFSHPFNRFGISPTYKWAKAHIGWRSMNLSQFTMNNTTVKGVGLELTPGKLRFSTMYGTLENSVELSGFSSEIPSYKRKILGVKLGVGSQNNFVDFIVMKAKDDLHSQQIPDSLSTFVEAKDNITIGIKNQISMFKKHLIFNCDLAGSLITNNTLNDSLDMSTLSIPPWMLDVFTPNASTDASYAVETSLAYKTSKFGLSTSFRRVMPGYNSLGAAYILNDLQAVTISPMLYLIKGKLQLTGNLGIQRNNLDGGRATTNNRKIGSVNCQITPSTKWGVNLAYSNFTFEQQMHIDSLYNDSILISQLNHQLTVTPRYSISTNRYMHNFMLMLTWQTFSNGNSANGNTSNNMTMCNLTYNLNQKKRKWGLTSGLNYFVFNTGNSDVQRTSFNVGGNTKMADGKISINTNVSFNNQEQNGEYTNYILGRIGATYKMFKKTSMGINLNENMAFLVDEKRNELSIQVLFSQRF